MSIKNSTIVVASFILIGRIAGFIREWLLSSISGANAETDLAVVLFTFPDLIVSLLLGGGLSSSLIPYLGSLEKQKKKKFIRQLSIYIGLIFLILSLVPQKLKQCRATISLFSLLAGITKSPFI